MKVHTTAFKEQIKEQGRELDSIITFGDTVLGAEELNAVTPSFQSNILKSAMKQLDIDSNIAIPIGTILNYKFGVKVNEEYEYIDFGNYIVYSVEKQEDTRSYKITCFDKMLYSMIEYKELQMPFPMSVRDYINNLCLMLGLTFKSANEEFANYDKIIESDLYANLGYTFRDIFDELAQVTASTICLNENDEVEIRYITETGDTIDEEFLKDVNVNFGEKFGAVNTIVLSRSADSDSIYYPETLPENPYEIKISDNQIMNGNDRDTYLPAIYEKLNGLEFYTNDFVSTGITYYDICDRYSVKIGDTTYSCVMFNDEVLVTQGLQENIFTEMPEETETDYTKSDKTDRKINQAYIIVDKQNGTIESLVQQTSETDDTIDAMQVTMNNNSLNISSLQTRTNNLENKEVTEVTTTTGFTFNAKGLLILDKKQENENVTYGYSTQITTQGTFYQYGNPEENPTILGEYTKDGSKQKDLELFGQYKYGKNNIDDDPMFITELFTDTNNEECFGHFYAGQ